MRAIVLIASLLLSSCFTYTQSHKDALETMRAIETIYRDNPDARPTDSAIQNDYTDADLVRSLENLKPSY